MAAQLLVGRNREILQIPFETWAQELSRAHSHADARLRFMTPHHHRVRTFAVTELVRTGQPVEPGTFSRELDLPVPEVEALLDELERRLFFLVRNEHGAVSWAYPVTAEPTPHRLKFSTGEQLYAA